MTNQSLFATRLLAHGGTGLPDNAWRAAEEAYGDKVLDHPAPDVVVRERLGRPAKLPATVAKSVARYATDASIAAALASDRRVGVQAELAAYWSPTPAMVDALVTARCDTDVAARLGHVALPADVRSRLWTRMRYLDALADAAREPQAATGDHVAGLLTRDDIDHLDCVPYVVRLVEHHPQVVDDVIDRARPAVLAALACTRLGVDRAERLLEQTPGRYRGDAEVWFAVADHPGTPLEVAQRAIARLDERSESLHRRVPVEPAAVPRVPTAGDWDEHAARVVLLRDGSSSAFQRVFHLRELYGATHLAPDVLATAAFRIAGAVGYHDGYRRLFDHVADRLREDLGQMAGNVLGTERDAYRCRPDTPRTVGPLDEPVRTRPSSRRPIDPKRLNDDAGEVLCAKASVHDAPTIAVHLNERLGDDITAWRLLWELQGGFAGTVDDLVALVDTIRG